MDVRQFVNKINDFISFFKKLDEPVAREIIDFIKSLVIPLRIKLCFEHLSCIEKIQRIKKEYETKAENNYIKFDNLELDQIIPRFRMLLSTNRHKANFDIPLVRQSNGIILVVEELVKNNNSYLLCRILTMPPNDFNPKFSQTEIAKNISRNMYKIYRIQDGTTVNIYYDSNYIDLEIFTRLEEDTLKIKTTKIYKLGKWIFSTKNAFDINSMIWRGFSYKKIMDDVFKRYIDFSFDKLDKNKTYTIGFKHPAFHPFTQPSEWLETSFESDENWVKNAWFIQSVDINTLNKDTNENIGLPVQTYIDQKNNFSEVFKKLGSSLKDFISNDKGKNPNIFLGLILRSNDENKTLDISDILLESTLWQEIRKLIYQMPYIQNKIIRDKQEQNFKNMSYIILDSYLDFRKRNIFIQIFPQYIGHHKKYDTIINDIVEKIYQNLISKNKNKTDSDKLFNKLYDIVHTQYSVSPDEKLFTPNTSKKNIKLLIVNTKYIDIYFNALHLVK